MGNIKLYIIITHDIYTVIVVLGDLTEISQMQHIFGTSTKIPHFPSHISHFSKIIIQTILQSPEGKFNCYEENMDHLPFDPLRLSCENVAVTPLAIPWTSLPSTSWGILMTEHSLNIQIPECCQTAHRGAALLILRLSDR